MFEKILIANRGEIAVRLIRACHEMGIAVVAVYSEADAHAMHVRLADKAILIGPPPPTESYLRGDALIEAALQSGAQAIHPGYGFLSENPDFARSVREAGLVFIGPPENAIRQMGIKTEARAIMEKAGVPIVPGFQSDTASDTDFQREADHIGYPVMVKAAGGGGGKGIRIVESPDALLDALGAARREAEHAFGNPVVFIERYIERGRHIEVQVLADQHGNTVHLFERECSIQRRHQKIIEETPSPLLDAETRKRMCEAAINAAKAVGYTNAGTVEFIADPRANFYFMEMNTRLQVEHPVTELVTGLDLAQLQIRIAAGEALPFSQADLTQRGHAIECRLYAEDPSSGFLPATGPVLKFIEPVGPGVRVDAGVASGDEVSVHYDPMIAKVVAYAGTREDAIRKMDWALGETAVLGVTTNLPFLHAVIRHPAFASGELSTHFIDEHLSDWQPDSGLPDAALIAAALSEMAGVDQGIRQSGENDGDSFNPWDRRDGFRMASS